MNPTDNSTGDDSFMKIALDLRKDIADATNEIRTEIAGLRGDVSDSRTGFGESVREAKEAIRSENSKARIAIAMAAAFWLVAVALTMVR